MFQQHVDSFGKERERVEEEEEAEEEEYYCLLFFCGRAWCLGRGRPQQALAMIEETLAV